MGRIHALIEELNLHEAMFSNKKLAPEVAEFLGHLAQRSRVHRKEVKREVRAAGLAQGRAMRATSEGDQDDDSDDIEDMKKAAASSPKSSLLSHYFEQLDSKPKAAAWLENDCAAISKNMTERYAKVSGRSRATWATAGPAGMASHSEIHTGMFFRHWKGAKAKEAARKLRLGVLSFLATQDAGKVKLHIWTDLSKGDKTIQDILGPIAHHPELMDAINITTFDHKAEFAKVPPSLAKETLTERYTKNSYPELNSDLYRAVVLYNYGGMWMDADTVLLKDVAPLLGEDWAHLVTGKAGAIEGALLSTSKPQSHFTNEYLISMIMRDQPLDQFDVEKPLLVDIFNNDPSHTTLHALPPCFFDSEPQSQPADTAVLSSDAVIGSRFFGQAVELPYRELFSLGIQDAAQDNSTADVSVLEGVSSSAPAPEQDADGEPQAPTSPSWAYHWRGNFAAAWAKGSMADVAERTFMQRLGLKWHK